MNEETVAVEEDVSSGAEAHDNVQSVVTQQLVQVFQAVVLNR